MKIYVIVYIIWILPKQNCYYNCNLILIIYVDCGDPTPNNGFAAFEGTHFGSRAIITCYIGYKVIGGSVLTCQAEGTWSDRPSCELVGKYWNEAGFVIFFYYQIAYLHCELLNWAWVTKLYLLVYLCY